MTPEVMERLRMESAIAFEKIPRRGLEIGGILLGGKHIEENAITFWVEEFRPVPSDYCQGPSYLVTESDLARLRDEAARFGEGCIGIYRSQTRTRQLSLDPLDLRAFEECFGDGHGLFLMLKSALGGAAFFARENGEMKCVRELALPVGSTRIMLRPGQPPRTADQRSPRMKSLPAPTARSAEMPAKLREGAKKVGWYTLAVVAMLALSSAVSALTATLVRGTSRSAAPPKVVDLKIQPAGSSIRLSWDRDSLPLQEAARVVLHVQDGDYQTERNLTAAEVRSGGITYAPRSAEVFFRIEAYPVGPDATGSLRVINFLSRSAPPAPAPAAAAAMPVAARPAQPVLRQVAVPPGPPATANVALLRALKGSNAPKLFWLGMSMRAVTRETALAFHLSQTYGFLISWVDPQSAATRSGIKSGDILLAVNGQRIADRQDLQLKIRELGQASTASLAIFREGEIQQIEMSTRELPTRIAQARP